MSKHTFKCCDNCWINDILYSSELNRYNSTYNIVFKAINNINVRRDLDNLLFKKFFNKTNNLHLNIDWFKSKYQNILEINNIVNQLISSLTNYYIQYNWSQILINNIIKCLVSCNYNLSGYVIDNDKNNISLDKDLYMWKQLLQNNFSQIIECLNTIKIKETNGYGEFLYSIISRDVICNNNDIGDILFNDNTIGEIKCGVNRQKAGRLLFKRDNYFGFNNALLYVNEQKKLLINFINQYIKDIQLQANLIQLVDHTIHFEFTWYGVYKKIYNILKDNKLNNICTEFVKYIFINSVKGWMPIRFTDMDLSNEDNFKIFNMVNYCLYYILFDASSENISKLIFIGNNDILILDKQLLLHGDLHLLQNILIDWEVAYPTSGLTKRDAMSHDRNKDKAPGIYKI